MSTIKSLRFEMSSSWNGDGVRQARNDIAALRRDIEELKAQRVTVKVDADVTEARRQIDELKREMESLHNSTVRINVDTGAATSQVREFQRRVDALSGTSIHINADTARAQAQIHDLNRIMNDMHNATLHVRADTGDAQARLDALGLRVRRLDGNAIRIPVHVDTNGPAQSIRRLDTAMGGLTNGIAAASSAFGGMTSAAGGAAGAMGSMGGSASQAGSSLSSMGSTGATALGWIAVGMYAIIALAPLVAASVAAIPLLFMGVGVMLMEHDKTLSKAWKADWQGVLQVLADAAKPMLQALVQGIDLLVGQLQVMKPLLREAFAAAAPLVGPFVELIMNLVRSLLPGLIIAMHNVGPIVDDLGVGFALLGRAVGMMFATFSQIPGLGRTLITVFQGLATFVGAFAQMIAQVVAADHGILLRTLLDSLSQILVALTPVLVRLAPLFAELTKLLGNYLVLALKLLIPILNALGPILLVLMQGLNLLYGAFIRVIDFLTKNFLPFWRSVWAQVQSIAGTVWGWLRTAWSAVVGAIMTAWNTTSRALTGAWNATWGAIVGAAKTTWGWLQTAWGTTINWIINTWNTIARNLTGAWNATWNGIVNIAKTTWGWIQNTWNSTLNFVMNVWNSTGRALSGAWNSVWTGIKGVAGTIWNWLSTSWNTLTRGFQTIWNNVSGPLKAAIEGTWTAIKNTAHTIWSGIAGVVVDVVNGVIGVINGIIGAWDTIVSHVGLGSLSIGKITFHATKPPGFATGGEIKGAGTGKSDSIPAMLSHGEYVINANAARMYGMDFLHAVNNTRFAMGGQVKYLSNGGLGGGNLPQNNQLPPGSSPGAIPPSVNGPNGGNPTTGPSHHHWWDSVTQFAKDIGSDVLKVGATAAKWVLGTIGAPAIRAAFGVFNHLFDPIANQGGVVGKFMVGESKNIEDALLNLLINKDAAASQVNGMYASAGPISFFHGVKLDQITIDALKKAFSYAGFQFSLTQGSYNPGGVAASAGTHDGGGALDAAVGGLSFSQQVAVVRALRKAGFAAWRRTPPAFVDHIHAELIGDPKASPAAMAQWSDYKQHLDGLADHAKDTNPVDVAAGWPAQPIIGGGGGQIPTGQHLQIIDAALTAAGISRSQWPVWEAGLNTLIGRESGWNAGAINLTDSNAAAGHPSKGLAQVIQPTFDAYHVSGTSSNIYDPVANVAAAVRYIIGHYGSITAVQQANPNLPPHGYRLGTISAARGWHLVGEDGPEAVNFGSGGASVHSFEETMKAVAEGFGSGGSGGLHIHDGAFPITIDGADADPREIAEAVAAMVAARLEAAAKRGRK